jgi:hypothetical protein
MSGELDFKQLNRERNKNVIFSQWDILLLSHWKSNSISHPYLMLTYIDHETIVFSQMGQKPFNHFKE